MAALITDGPIYAYGNTEAILLSTFGVTVGDPNLGAGPSVFFQGQGFLDPRYYFGKDKVVGYAGVVEAHFAMPVARSISQIPAALSTTIIAGAQGVTTGVPMTLAAANATGVTINIPYIGFSAAGANAGPTLVAPVMLDFGFAFGTVVSGNLTVTVADSNAFLVGMPIVIAGAGNAAGTVPLMTTVASIASATTITINNLPLASVNPAAIGTGNIWGPTEVTTSLAASTPTAALPWLAAGAGLFLDARQAITRCVSVTGASGGTGGTVTIRGLDIFNVPITQTVTVAAGANTVYTQKCFKAVLSVTPNFTDTSHNYSVGTGDVFGFHYRTPTWEDTQVFWAGNAMTATQGWTAPLAIPTASTALTADVRGTIQTGAGGAGTGIGSTASNGTVSSLAMSGNRLMMQQNIRISEMIFGSPANAAALFGVQF